MGGLQTKMRTLCPDCYQWHVPRVVVGALAVEGTNDKEGSAHD